MIIPRSQGRTVSQPTLQQHTPMTGLSNLGNAIGGALEARDAKQREEEAQQKSIALYHDNIATEEAKVKLDDVLTTEMAEQSTLVKNEVSQGRLSADQGAANLKAWSDSRYQQLENEMPMHSREKLKRYWDDSQQREAVGLLPLQLRADAQKGVVLADRYSEIASRYDRKQGREYLETNLSSLNLSESDKQARLYKYESGQDLSEIDGVISTAIENKDTAALHQLIKKMDDGGFGYTDAQTLQQKRNQALSRIDALDTQAKILANNRNSEASKALSEYKANVLTGRAQDSDYESNVAQLVAGTESEAEFNFLKQQSVNFQKFANKSTSEQLKLINEQKAKMKNTPSSSADDEEKILGVYEEIYKNKVDTAKNNPNQLVREAGVEVHSLGGTSINTNTSNWIDGAISNGISQLSMKDANITVKPISSEDLPEAKKAFEAKSVNDKLSFIGELIDKTKGVPNGAKIWGATLGQLGSGDQNYIAAGIAKMNNFRSTENRELATSIVNGTQLLKNKQLVLPKDDILRGKFNEYMGNTVTGTSANNSFNVFKAVYADTLNERGLTHTTSDEAPDKGALAAALAFASGGVYQQSGKFTNYMGGKMDNWKVDKPYGMTDDTFESRIDAGYTSLAKHTGMSESELKTFRLRQSPVKSKNGSIQYDLLNERGNPLKIGNVTWRIVINGATK